MPSRENKTRSTRKPSSPKATPTPARRKRRASTARARSASSDSPATDANAQRLNKILAAAGLGSRRKVEDLIQQGRVQIDGEIVTDLACKVDPRSVKIKVDGEPLKRSRPVYFALNKPSGVLSTNYDPSGRMRVIDLVPDRDRVFSVGRLDQSSEGLMLLTNDGELAQRLAHPKFRIQKTYFVVVSGQMTEEELAGLRKGVHLAEGFARIDGATIKKHRKGCTELEIVLSEGKNREIRRILARAGHKVVLLRRLAIGPLRLGQMPVGASRELTPAEIKALYVASDPANRPKKLLAKKPTKKVAAPNSHSKAGGAPTKAPTEENDDDLLSTAHLIAEDLSGDFSGSGNLGSVISYDEDDTASTRVERVGRRGKASSRNTQPSSRQGQRPNRTRSAEPSRGTATSPSRSVKSRGKPRSAASAKPSAKRGRKGGPR